jgi:hypothetical protein
MRRYRLIIIAAIALIVVIAAMSQRSKSREIPHPMVTVTVTASEANCKAAIQTEYGQAVKETDTPIHFNPPAACDGLPPDIVLEYLANTIQQG